MRTSAIIVVGMLSCAVAGAEPLGGDPQGLRPASARTALRGMLGGAVGGKQHVARARRWLRVGKTGEVTAVWNRLGRAGGYLSVKSVSAKPGKQTSTRYVSYDPSRRAAAYIVTHQGPRTYREILRQSSALAVSQEQLAKVLGVQAASLGQPRGFAIQEARIRREVPTPDGQGMLREAGRYFLTSANGKRIAPLDAAQVMQLNRLHHEGAR